MRVMSAHAVGYSHLISARIDLSATSLVPTLALADAKQAPFGDCPGRTTYLCSSAPTSIRSHVRSQAEDSPDMLTRAEDVLCACPRGQLQKVLDDLEASLDFNAMAGAEVRDSEAFERGANAGRSTSTSVRPGDSLGSSTV